MEPADLIDKRALAPVPKQLLLLRRLLFLDGLHEREEIDAERERLQCGRHFHALRSLVVLDEAAHGALRGAQRAVEHVAERVALVDAVLGPHGARLVVGAVRAGHQLAVLALALVVAGEPALKVVLHGSGVVELTGHDGNYMIGDLKALVKLLGSLDHVFVFVPGLLRLREHELLNLLELVHPEDAADVAAAAAGLPPEAGGDAHIADRKLGLVQALRPVESRDGLLRRRDEVLVQLRLVLVLDNLVQHVVVVVELGGLCHEVLLHEEWRLDGGVAPLMQERDAVVDQRLVQQHPRASEEVAAVSGNIVARSELHGTNHLQQLKVRPEPVCLILELTEVPRLAPLGGDLVVLLLVLGHGHLVAHEVADLLNLRVPLFEELVGHLLELQDLGLQRHLLLQLVLALVRTLRVLLSLGDHGLDLADLLALLLRVVLRLSPLLVNCDHLVNGLWTAEAAGFGLLHLVGAFPDDLNANGHGWRRCVEPPAPARKLRGPADGAGEDPRRYII
mmetsp:Transcript_27363/g.71655  ORF Transcript_27363/g.71655 Transcript_27363/m.71655 type:complete len:506 (+) Transcript_27363:214-1731(+)